MLSFHNDQEVKDKYLSRVINHRIEDNIIQGIGWEKGKGCAVGCTLENYSHDRYPIELGLPKWLARLEDSIFEGLPDEEAKLWPEKFLSSIPVGVDVEIVKHQLAILRMNRLIKIQNNLLINNPSLKEVIKEVISSIEVVKRCHECEINKTCCDWSVARSAAKSAARSAEREADSAAWEVARAVARSAESAAQSAAWAAERAADSAVRSPVWAVDSAAWAVAWAAPRSEWSSAKSAVWKQEAKDLLILLENL
jgi:hypothetical protein